MKTMKKAVMTMSLLSIALLGSCNGGNSTPTPSTSDKGGTSDKGSSSSEDESEFYVLYKGNTYDSGKSYDVSITTGDNAAMLVTGSETGTASGFTFASSDDKVLSVATTGKLTAAKAGTATITVKDSNNETLTLNFTITDATLSTGGHSYTSVSYDEKSRILAALEKYAVDNYLTGITIFSNGSKIAYNTRYVPEPQSYINGYGWGTTREGKLTAPLPDAMSGKTTYYNIGTTSLPQHANAMNASGSDVSTVYDYISTAYYATRMNATADGYEWYPSLATDERPIPVKEPELNADGTVKTPGAAIASTDPKYNSNRRWRIHLRDGVVYRTGSQNSFTKTYDGKQVELNDYLTPLQFMLTGWNEQYRGAELTEGVSGFTGAAKYFNSTTTNPNGSSDTSIVNQAKWNEIMGSNIYVGHDDGGNFIEFNLLEDCTQFYAMYYLSSSLYSPLPASFIKRWGGKTLGKSTASGDANSLDTMLATGPYYIESWDAQTINFKKNDQYFWKEDTFTNALGGTTTRKVYNLDGISYNYIGDSSQVINQFTSGKIDSYAPKAEEMKTGGVFASDSGGSGNAKWRLYETKGDSNFKLNVNASSETDWIKRFGTQGTNAQVAYSTNTWSALNKDLNNKKPQTACKPYMNNIHFLNFLSFAINRKEICEARGSTPTQEYFSDNYLIDPENGVSYNSTAAHKAVLADRYNDTYGFNEDYAASELRQAFEDVIVPLGSYGAFGTKAGGANGGTSRNPYMVPVDMEWMNTTDKTEYADVFTYVKKIFSKVSSEDYGGGYELDIQETNGDADYQQVYNKMKQGQFDLGFGSISGNALNPLNFLEVLKSDNSSSFTLNWGPDTSVVGSGLYKKGDSRNTIYYDGQSWSFDGLWASADKGALLDNKGALAEVTNSSTANFANGTRYQSVNDTDHSATYRLSFKQLIEGGATSIKFELSNSSAATATYVVLGTAGDGETKLDLDSNDEVTLTIGKGYNTSVGSDKENAREVTLEIKYSGTLVNGMKGSSTSLTKDFTTTMNLLTYFGLTNSAN